MMQSKMDEREKIKERQTEKKKKLPSYFHGFYLAETLYSGFGFHLTLSLSRKLRSYNNGGNLVDTIMKYGVEAVPHARATLIE